MGGIILVAVILIWALKYFPRGGSQATPEQRLSDSYIGRIGRTIEPVIRPLGFEWRMGVSLITGAVAKEVVVSTMAALFESGHHVPGKESANLSTTIRSETYHSGSRAGTSVFTPLAGISYLLFILIYMPCIAVIATVRKESSSWKWTAFLIVYTTSLAWILSFCVFQIGSLLI